MASLVKLVEMLQRAKDGPACSIREWEIKRMPKTVQKYLKKYELEKTFNPETPVNQDLELGDRFFEAGLEMAAELGLLFIDTETVVNVSKEEILEAVDRAPAQLELGLGKSRLNLSARRPEDSRPPVFAGPLCIQVSEELYVPITEGILRSKQVRIQGGPSIDTVFGYPVYSHTPFESAAAFRDNRLRREAQWRADRIGIPNEGIASSTTEYGNLAGFAEQNTESNPSIALILHPAEMKIGYASFHKAIVAAGYNAYILGGTHSMIGGYSGSAEGAALANVANALLQFPILQVDIPDTTIYDVRNDSTCGRHGLWAMSVSLQALSRNTHTLLHNAINQSAGPCTEEILYTATAGQTAAAVSGITYTVGVRSAGGRFKNYITPLEHWFCAASFEACAGMTLEQANELVLYLLSKYESTLSQPPKGKSFPECFDVETITPTKEWQGISDRVATDMKDHGLEVVPII